MDDQLKLQSLFSKYLERSCTPEEVKELIGLLQAAKGEETLTEQMEALWQEIKEDPSEYPVDWDKMYGMIRQTEEDLIVLNQRRNTQVRRNWTQAAAAALILLLSSAFFWVILGNRNNIPGQVQPQDRTAAGQKTPNKKQIIHLPDGSTVILNENSKLDYPKFFTGKTREVSLSGEGYFDVIHLASQPFLVHTGKITTRVIGTAFNIKAYPEDEAIEVTVTRGRVQVEKENIKMGLLSANQQIRFSTKTEGYVQKRVDIQHVIAWKPDEINFDDITMQEAARQIGQRFNSTIEFANPAIKDCRITATFYAIDKLNEIMTVICGVSQSNFTIDNNKIIIDGKGCN